MTSVSYPLQLSSVSSNHAAVYEESIKHPEQFWGDLARRRLKWFKEFDQVMDCDMEKGEFSWFIGGVINVSGKFNQQTASFCTTQVFLFFIIFFCDGDTVQLSVWISMAN